MYKKIKEKEKELEYIAKMFLDGCTVSTIAQKMNYCDQTIKYKIRKLFKNYSVKNRGEFISAYYKRIILIKNNKILRLENLLQRFIKITTIINSKLNIETLAVLINEAKSFK